MHTSRFAVLAGWVGLTLSVGCAFDSSKELQPFGGKIAKSYEESQEWWAEPVRPHPDAPNPKTSVWGDARDGTRGRCFAFTYGWPGDRFVALVPPRIESALKPAFF